MIPFATLLSALPAGQLADWAWLARQLAISHVPSVSAWLALRQLPHGQSAPEPLIAWGDPAFSLVPAAKVAGNSNARDLTLTRSSATATIQYTELPPLPETRVEILAIAAALKANQSDLLLGAMATRDSVIEANRNGALAKKRVIVFATHGLMAGDLPGSNSRPWPWLRHQTIATPWRR